MLTANRLFFLGLFAMFSAIIGGVVLLAYATTGFIQAVTLSYADNFRVVMPDQPTSVDEAEGLLCGLASFQQRASTQQGVPAVIDARHINLLLSLDPHFSDLFRVSLRDGKIDALLSLSPGGDFGFGVGMNGGARLSLEFINGSIGLYVQSFEAKNRSMPDLMLHYLERVNLLGRLYRPGKRYAEVRTFLRHLQEISVQEASIIIVPIGVVPHATALPISEIKPAVGSCKVSEYFSFGSPARALRLYNPDAAL